MKDTLPTPVPGGIDPVSIKDLRYFLDFVRRRGVRVVIVSTPVHATARRIWRSEGSAADERRALEIIAGVAREQRIPLVDFSSVEQFGGDPNGFFDGFHPIPDTTRKMIDAIFQPRKI